MNQGNPIIVQSDRSILLEVDHPLHEEARDALAQFAELEKSPEHIHTYRLTPLSLWNAAAGGMDAPTIVDLLTSYSKYPLPSNITTEIQTYIHRYGRVKLLREGDELLLYSDDHALMAEIINHKKMLPYIQEQINRNTIKIDPSRRGHVKQALIHIGFPAEDLAGYTEGSPLPLQLRELTLQGKQFEPRQYQQAAVSAFHAGGAPSGGSGVVVLPCGAGKTIVGITAIATLQRATLILTPNTVAVRQWIHEILDKTDIPPEMIGEYTGERKEIAPITVSTYQILTYRRAEAGNTSDVGPATYPHFSLFTNYDWGLIIYDEVHLLPAPVFRFTAEIQARRRLGLTATLVREDGCEADVFSLIGPKKFDVPWRELEHQGWIATAECHEIRVGFPNEDDQLNYAMAETREKYRIAAENPAKLEIARHLIARHADDQILIIGQYLDQLKLLAEELAAPMLTGRTATAQREKLYEQFRRGEIKRLVVSKVANFAIDLPDANVAIQVSGTFGSRQEEAQRLGRILRPKGDGGSAYFYSVVTRDTRDQEFSANRQLFLTEQGYRYLIEDAETLLAAQQ
ncbi:DNA repair helicase XPB [Dictyobacter kobayashii]|uniref:DNA 3'-5' helicase n=1 Tax=Dictyobacter kobayashii TaxID=2014872 RepID=A0A402AN47_9CHLR|nr:DNA repair helicase XPB [Dictyobacter kobayashii]GCE20454.1 DEAD/DEAH box helicase [Dictyobacter kobayashii]